MSESDELDTVPEPNPLDRLERPPAWEWRAARALRAPRPAGAYFLTAELEGVAAGVWQARADAWQTGRAGEPGSG
jgi:hypothetical protein